MALFQITKGDLMRVLNLFLVGAVGTLVACSNGGGGSGGDNGFEDYKPAEKPANAISKADLQYYVTVAKTSTKVLPEDAAIYKIVVSGAKAQPVAPDARAEALAKLDGNGKAALQSIQTNCTITDAVGSSQGDQELRVGAQTLDTAKMSLSGAQCPLSGMVQEESRTIIKDLKANQSTNTAEIDTEVTQRSYTGRRVDSQELRDLSGFAGMELQVSTSGRVKLSIAQDKMSMEAQLKGKGQLQINLADGDIVKGPVNFEASVADGKMMAQYLFDGTTRRGALRVVVLVNQYQATYYVNGVQMSPEEIDGLVPAVQMQKFQTNVEIAAKNLLN
ncbi:hypothetical protein D3C87_124020 [compost metagenome]